MTADARELEILKRFAEPLEGGRADHDRLLERIGDAEIVLLGTTSHGTHELYRERARITKALVARAGFSAVAIEADWPDAFRVQRYLHGRAADADAEEALGAFARFPAWMWRNADVLDFVGWLREHDDALPEGERVGFYGLDLFGMHGAMDAVVRHLEHVAPDVARRARDRYASVARMDLEGAEDARAVDACEDLVVSRLLDIARIAARPPWESGVLADDERFHAAQSARLVTDAEAYYRAMYRAGPTAWNLRTRHMASVLGDLQDHLVATRGRRARTVVWTHAAHAGDARATDQGRRGELSLGQLVRQRLGARAVSIGLTTYEGTVTVASQWNGPALRRRLRPAAPESVEAMLHALGIPRFSMWLRRDDEELAPLRVRRPERLVGVVESRGGDPGEYVDAAPARQFDALVHVDRTRAVEPLERTVPASPLEAPETFPSSL